MIKVLTLALLCNFAHAYVPTVESLFRHGSNPEVSVNGLSITFSVKRILPEDKTQGASVNDASLLKDESAKEFYKLFITKAGEGMKVAQTKYKSNSYSEGSLEHKIYYPNLNAYTFKPSIEQAEKGVFFGLIHSLALNDGAHFVNYLKSLGVPVKLNNEIINREKIEFLADYKRYLTLVAKDRNAKKTEVNPMNPEDPAAKQRADEIMSQPMYTDLKQVKLSKDEGQVAWVVNAGPFEAVVSYKERDVQRVKYKSAAGDFEIVCKDYWLANGTHALPKYMMIKNFAGQLYQVEVTNLRQYVEKEEDLVKRLRNWDQILKGKESHDARPEFLL